MTQLQRTITYLIALVFVLGITWLVLPHHTYTPQGLFLPANTSRSPVMPDQVKLVDNKNATGVFLGYINVQAYAPKVDADVVKAMERYAVTLAASVGANQLAVMQFGQSTAQQLIVFQARAMLN